MGFDNSNACGRLTELLRVRFDHRKAYRKLAEVRSVPF